MFRKTPTGATSEKIIAAMADSDENWDVLAERLDLMPERSPAMAEFADSLAKGPIKESNDLPALEPEPESAPSGTFSRAEQAALESLVEIEEEIGRIRKAILARTHTLTAKQSIKIVFIKSLVRRLRLK